jgi:chemotaxis protein CheC
MKTPPVFSPGMLDVLQELMNIGVGRAARAIAELSGREVVLRVVEVEVLDLADPRQFAELRGQINLRICQEFGGGLEGCGLFALHRSGAVRLSQLLLGKVEHDAASDDLDQGALLELGGIVISSTVGLLASELDLEVRFELPQWQLRGTKDVADLFAGVAHADQTPALVMRASLDLRGEMVHGFLALFFPRSGLRALTSRLARLAP